MINDKRQTLNDKRATRFEGGQAHKRAGTKLDEILGRSAKVFTVASSRPTLAGYHSSAALVQQLLRSFGQLEPRRESIARMA